MHIGHRRASKTESKITKKKFRDRCQMTDLLTGSNIPIIGMHKTLRKYWRNNTQSCKAETILVQLENLNLQLESTQGTTSRIDNN